MGVDEDKRATLRRFAAVGAAGPLARLAGGDSDDDGASGSDVRRDHGLPCEDAGRTLLEAPGRSPTGDGETQHHLRRLCADGVVESVRDGEYKRFYPAGRFSAFERRALGYLRRETARGMIRELLSNPDASAGAVADALDVSPATVSKYGAELEAAGVLSRADGYEIQEPETLVVLLVRYADSFDAATVAFASEAASMVSYDP